MKPPHVFISYAHEDETYRVLVQRLGARLREDGVDAHLDVWDLHGRPFVDFMNSEVRRADKVLVLCSPKYREGVHLMQDGNAASGRGWEAMLITAQMAADYKKRKRLVLTVARGTREDAVPDSLIGFECHKLLLESFDESDYNKVLSELFGAAPSGPPVEVKSRPASPGVTPLRGTQLPTDNRVFHAESPEFPLRALNPDQPVTVQTTNTKATGEQFGTAAKAIRPGAVEPRTPCPDNRYTNTVADSTSTGLQPPKPLVTVAAVRFHRVLRNDALLDTLLQNPERTGNGLLDGILDLTSNLAAAQEKVEVIGADDRTRIRLNDRESVLAFLLADFVVNTASENSLRWLIGRTAKKKPSSSDFLSKVWSAIASHYLAHGSPGYSPEFVTQMLNDITSVFADDSTGNRIFRFFDLVWQGMGEVPSAVEACLELLGRLHDDESAQPERRGKLEIIATKGQIAAGKLHPRAPELVEIPSGGCVPYDFQSMVAPITNAECASVGIEAPKDSPEPFTLGPWNWRDFQYPEIATLLTRILSAYEQLFSSTNFHWSIPTVAEWLRLADCESNNYPWGDENPNRKHANLKFDRSGKGTRKLKPVRSYAAGKSRFGTYDCCGNIHELVCLHREMRIPDDTRLMGGCFLTRPEHSSCQIVRKVRRRNPDTRRNIGVRLVLVPDHASQKRWDATGALATIRATFVAGRGRSRDSGSSA